MRGRAGGLSFTHTHSLARSLAYSLSHTLSHTHSLSLSHTHSLSLTQRPLARLYTWSPSPSPSQSRAQPPKHHSLARAHLCVQELSLARALARAHTARFRARTPLSLARTHHFLRAHTCVYHLSLSFLTLSPSPTLSPFPSQTCLQLLLPPPSHTISCRILPFTGLHPHTYLQILSVSYTQTYSLAHTHTDSLSCTHSPTHTCSPAYRSPPAPPPPPTHSPACRFQRARNQR